MLAYFRDFLVQRACYILKITIDNKMMPYAINSNFYNASLGVCFFKQH